LTNQVRKPNMGIHLSGYSVSKRYTEEGDHPDWGRGESGGGGKKKRGASK